jgi:hypothetical protein
MTDLAKTSLDKLLARVDPKDPQSTFTDAGLFGQLKKALAERMLQAELDHYLAQQRQASEPVRNHKNGTSVENLPTDIAGLLYTASRIGLAIVNQTDPNWTRSRIDDGGHALDLI